MGTCDHIPRLHERPLGPDDRMTLARVDAQQPAAPSPPSSLLGALAPARARREEGGSRDGDWEELEGFLDLAGEEVDELDGLKEGEEEKQTR